MELNEKSGDLRLSGKIATEPQIQKGLNGSTKMLYNFAYFSE